VPDFALAAREMSAMAGSAARKTDAVDYSVVIPVFNEEEGLPALWERLSAALDKLDGPSEAVFVNDGSKDGTLDGLKRLRASDPRVKIISFSRNFGHQIAISAGMDYSSGRAVVVIDADLQDPPELIPDMIEKWRDGYEVVYAVREKREGESRFKLLTAALFYRVLRRLTNVDIPVDVGDFRLVGRRALDALCGMREHHRFVRGMVSWVGFPQTGVGYQRAPRFAGETKYPLKKMVKFAFDGITSFSWVPLRLASYFGLIAAIISFLVVVWALYVKFILRDAIPGWSSLIVAVMAVASVQFLTLWIVGEYVGRIYDEVRQRPLYIIGEAHGFSDDDR